MTAEHDADRPQFVLTLAGEVHGEDSPENREIVRRIHACVSACEGFSTDELERGVVQDMRRVIGQVAPLLQTRVQQRPAGTSTVKPPVTINESRTAACSMHDAC